MGLNNKNKMKLHKKLNKSYNSNLKIMIQKFMTKFNKKIINFELIDTQKKRFQHQYKNQRLYLM